MDRPPLQSTGDPTESDPPVLSKEEIKHRTSAGVFIVGSRGLIVLLLGFGGYIALARLLDPHDFGVIALGTSVMMVSGLLADGGLGAALIRRPASPEHAELGGLVALQLSMTATVAAIAAAVATPIGGQAWVIAAMAGSMPIVALQFPGRITLEREIAYRPLALVEISQVFTYHAAAVGLVLAGLGVWGVAVATVIRALVATTIMAQVSPVGLVWPQFTMERIRPLMAFGVRFQAVEATWILRGYLLNALIAVIANVSTLGLWHLAERVMALPNVVLQALWRVSYPAMSKLVGAGAVAATLIERAAGMCTVGAGTVLVGLAAGAPGLVPGVFGEQWREVATVIPWACFGVAIGGSVSVATQGYLYAVGDASAVLRAGVAQGLTWFAVTLPLLNLIGVTAVGLGWLGSGIVGAIVLHRATSRQIPIRLVPVLAAPVTIGVAAAAVGWSITHIDGADLVSGLAGGGTAICLFHLGLLAFRRDLLRETYGFVFNAMRAAGSRRPAAA